MKRKLPVSVYHSFEEADAALLRDALAMKPKERVDAVNLIRRRVYQLQGIAADNKVERCITYAKRNMMR